MSKKRKGAVSPGKTLLALCTGGLSLPVTGIRKKSVKGSSSSSRVSSDLVFVGYIGACCPKCAMYRNRVYSVHGKDRRFPQLPKDFRESCCGLTKYPYTYELDKHPFNTKWEDAIRYSNRPFIDDRTEDEIKNYEDFLRKVAENREREKDRKAYEKLVFTLPEVAPQSFASYRRIKKAGGETFTELKKKARAAGIKL